MNIQELTKRWEKESRIELAQEQFSVQLSVEDMARLCALNDMYPGKNRSELIAELISAALNEIESGFPYIAGHKVIARDEEGDPLYEDIGPTPQYLSLAKTHLKKLKTAH